MMVFFPKDVSKKVGKQISVFNFLEQILLLVLPCNKYGFTPQTDVFALEVVHSVTHMTFDFFLCVYRLR